MSDTTEKKRGRETAGDMVRSLGLVLVAVVGIWYLAQPPDSDEKVIRVIDPTGDVSAFAADAPGVPVPRAVPSSWRSTSSEVVGEPASLRVGWVTPDDTYAEYAASAAPAEDFVPEITGEKARRLDPVQVAGGTWEQYRDEDGSLSLVRSYGATTVVVGTLRATATLEDLRALAEGLR